MRFQRRVQLVEDDARFDASPPFLDPNLKQAIEVFGRVNDQAPPDRLSGLRRAAAALGDSGAVSGVALLVPEMPEKMLATVLRVLGEKSAMAATKSLPEGVERAGSSDGLP